MSATGSVLLPGDAPTPGPAAAGGPLLRIRDLAVEFVTPDRRSTPLTGVNLDVATGEVLGLVGETGCGKTLTGLATLGLLPPTSRISRGSVEFEGRDLAERSERELRSIRGSRIAMIFQNPATAFNPVFTIGTQIGQVLSAHERLSRPEARDRIRAGLAEVGLPETERVLRAYPHQLSGGMLQRAMIAMALVCRPALLIADEPTTALDVTIAAQILRLLRSLQEEQRFSILFITHDLGVIRTVADRVAVLYAGRVIEEARTSELFADPQHPYTRGLIGAVPGRDTRGRQLASIPGAPPLDPGTITGCAFAARCPIAIDRCRVERPLLLGVGGPNVGQPPIDDLRGDPDGHAAACHLADGR